MCDLKVHQDTCYSRIANYLSILINNVFLPTIIGMSFFHRSLIKEYCVRGSPSQDATDEGVVLGPRTRRVHHAQIVETCSEVRKN